MKEAIPSVARVAGHPIHPMLVPFPVAFLCALPLTDFVYYKTGDAFWIGASWWLCLAGLATALLAAVAGAADFFGRKKTREYRAARVHFVGNLIAVLITALNLYLRFKHPDDIPLPWGLPLSLAVLAILGVTGWYGGELAYRYRIGGIPE